MCCWAEMLERELHLRHNFRMQWMLPGDDVSDGFACNLWRRRRGLPGVRPEVRRYLRFGKVFVRLDRKPLRPRPAVCRGNMQVQRDIVPDRLLQPKRQHVCRAAD